MKCALEAQGLPNGSTFYTGTYTAMWRHSPDTGWKLRSELFVSLTCADSASCDAIKKRYAAPATPK